jgi:hypothetical protein
VSLTLPPRRSWLAAVLLAALPGCGSTQGITQTAFERQASDGASIMSAASTTLQFVHGQPPSMTVEYGAGSMVNYADQVSSLSEELPQAEGAPDQQTLQPVLDSLDPAVAAIENPCLVADCDWQSQIAALDAARDALLAASEES